nr:EAL domain-containing protein [Shewanella marina]
MVLNQAVADLAKLNQLGFKLSVAINVSTRQCINNQTYRFEQLLAATIKKYQVAATDIHIEITESMLMTDDDINMRTLTAIRSLGCQIYMDDFGTGYSSLSYLKRFPINVIKIDRSFIENSTNSHADKNLIAAIVSMGKSLEMKLVAEGIETIEQWQYLQQLGCNFAQGYLLSKPLPFDTLVDLLNQTQQQSLLLHTDVAMA